MNDENFWIREHSADNPPVKDIKSINGPPLDNRNKTVAEVWGLFRKLEAEPDHQKRVNIRLKIWNMVENGAGN
ncbi:hypothetical protein ACRQ84_23190 (plasmid) [Enterobacter ludwigii]